jgi:hypothetical protein
MAPRMTIPPSRLAASMLIVALAWVQTMPAVAVDEPQVSNYVPWFSGTRAAWTVSGR